MNRKLLIVMLLLLVHSLRAQTASIRGVVLDESKALIPGVTVEMEHPATGLKRTTITDGEGRFTFLGVPIGIIRVTASLPGFQISRQEIQLGTEAAQLSITLKVASVNTSVEVSVAAPLPMLSSASSVAQVVPAGRRPASMPPASVVDRGPLPMNTESYAYLDENQFTRVTAQP